MAYVTKYRCEWADIDNNLFYFDILQEGFSGSITALQGGAVPMEIESRDESKNVFAAVIGHSANFQVIGQDGFSLASIYTQNERDLKVTAYEGAPGGGGSIIFAGWLMTETIYEDYQDEPFSINFSAHNGIAALKNIAFRGDAGAAITGKITLLEAIRQCLFWTGLGLDFYTAFNTYQYEDANGGADDPLVGTYVSARNFYINETTPKNCYDVLEGILAALNMRVFHFKGAWHVLSIPEQTAVQYYRRKYNSAGVLQDHGVATSVPSLGRGGDFRPVSRDGIDGYNPAYASTALYFDYGIQENIAENPFFALGTSGLPAGYVRVGLTTPETARGGTGTETDPYSLRIFGETDQLVTDTKYVELEDWLLVEARSVIEVTTEIKNFNTIGGKIMVYADDDNGNQVYLDRNGKWWKDTPRVIIIENFSAGNTPKETPAKITITADPLPKYPTVLTEYTRVKVRMYRGIAKGGTVSSPYVDYNFLSLSQKKSETEKSAIGELHTVLTIPVPAYKTGNEQTVLIGDNHLSASAQGALFRADAETRSQWWVPYDHPFGEIFPLLRIMAQQRQVIFSRPQIRWRGTLKGYGGMLFTPELTATGFAGTRLLILAETLNYKTGETWVDATEIYQKDWTWINDTLQWNQTFIYEGDKTSQGGRGGAGYGSTINVTSQPSYYQNTNGITGVNPGTYGSPTKAPVMTVSEDGKALEITEEVITPEWDNVQNKPADLARTGENEAITGQWTFDVAIPTTTQTPTASGHLITKSYFDANLAAASNGIKPKREVYAASTANLTLSGSQTVDGTTPPNGSYVLAKDQNTGGENGVWVVNTSGAWTRDTAADTEAELLGSQHFVQNGTTNAGTKWYLQTVAPITVGTTPLVYIKTDGAEIDPTVPSWVKGILQTQIANWNTAYGWGDHGAAGYFLASNFNGSFDTQLATKTTANLTEGANLYFTEARVRATPLTGLPTEADTAILATDTILAAFAKVKASLAARQAASVRLDELSAMSGKPNGLMVFDGGANDGEFKTVALQRTQQITIANPNGIGAAPVIGHADSGSGAGDIGILKYDAQGHLIFVRGLTYPDIEGLLPDYMKRDTRRPSFSFVPIEAQVNQAFSETYLLSAVKTSYHNMENVQVKAIIFTSPVTAVHNPDTGQLTIGGTPTQSGEQTVTLITEDNFGNVGLDTITINIGGPPQPCGVRPTFDTFSGPAIYDIDSGRAMVKLLPGSATRVLWKTYTESISEEVEPLVIEAETTTGGTAQISDTTIVLRGGSDTAPYTFNVPAGGSYPLRILYSANNDSNGFTLSVNGGAGQFVSIANSGGWDNYVWSLPQDIYLNTGSNTIVLTGKDFSPTNIDKIEIGSGGGGTGFDLSKVAYVGNSITDYGGNGVFPEWDAHVGSGNSWGMSASAEAQDYVHKVNAALGITDFHISPGGFHLETDYANLNLSGVYPATRDYLPTTIIVRLGENATSVNSGNMTQWKNGIVSAVNYIKNGRNVGVIITGVFYSNMPNLAALETGLSQAASELGATWVQLSDLGEANYYATQFNDSGVQRHPNDAGHTAIANRIVGAANASGFGTTKNRTLYDQGTATATPNTQIVFSRQHEAGGYVLTIEGSSCTSTPVEAAFTVVPNSASLIVDLLNDPGINPTKIVGISNGATYTLPNGWDLRPILTGIPHTQIVQQLYKRVNGAFSLRYAPPTLQLSEIAYEGTYSLFGDGHNNLSREQSGTQLREGTYQYVLIAYNGALKTRELTLTYTLTAVPDGPTDETRQIEATCYLL